MTETQDARQLSPPGKFISQGPTHPEKLASLLDRERESVFV
jgi:hypothetical protein